MKKRLAHLFLTLSLIFLCGCQKKETILKIAATPTPHAEILEIVKPDLENMGIELKIVEVDDYNLPNRLLAENQVEANFFQHRPFLKEQNKRCHYHLQELAPVHIEPLGIYSKKIQALDDLKEGAILAIPNDPTNESRALTLLSEIGLIKLEERSDKSLLTIYDVSENIKNLKIEEIDAAFLPRCLEDVDAAIIPANFALQAGLNPMTDAFALESVDSPYVNIVVIRANDSEKEELIRLKNVLNSEKVRQFILEKYRGAITPAF